VGLCGNSLLGSISRATVKSARTSYSRGDQAEQKLVTLGPTDGDLVSVTGVAATDRVITGSLQKLGPGALVKPTVEENAPSVPTQ